MFIACVELALELCCSF